MSFIYGLNVANALQDVDRTDIALGNLGLRKQNLDLIRDVGLAEIARIDEIHLISGLTDNQAFILSGMDGSSSEVKSLIDDVPDASAPSGETPSPQEYNLNLNDRLVAGAIKYNYTDFLTPAPVTIENASISLVGNNSIGQGRIRAVGVFADANNNEVVVSEGDKIVIGGTSGLTEGNYTVLQVIPGTNLEIVLHASPGNLSSVSSSSATFAVQKYWDIKNADISTSRVSSWSPIGDPTPDSHIIYGGQLKNNGEFLAIEDLGITTAPLSKRYRSEQATHILQIHVNGAYRDFPCVRGLPLQFRIGSIGTKNPDIRVGVSKPFLSDSDGVIPVTITREFETQTRVQESAPDAGPDGTGTDPDMIEHGKFAQYTNTSGGTLDSTISIYYVPDRIRYLKISALSISQYNVPPLSGLTSLNIMDNSISRMPLLTTLHPVLKRFQARGNAFYSEVGLVSPPSFTYQNMIERIPTTADLIDLRVCIRGASNLSTTNLDFTIFPDLKTLKIGGGNSDNTGFNVSVRIGSDSHSSALSSDMGLMPDVPNPNVRFQFHGALYPQSSSGFIGNGSAHPFSDGDLVQYWARVDSNGVLGVPKSGLNSASARPGANNANTVYQVAVASEYWFTLVPVGGGSTLATGPAMGSGTLHELVKVSDANGTIHKEDKGIEHYECEYTNYTALPNSVAQSEKLERLKIKGSYLNTSEYPYRDSTNATTQEESDYQAAVFLDTNLLEGDTPLVFERTHCNIPDLSGNTLLKTISFTNIACDPDIKTTALRAINANLFNNLPALRSFTMNDIGDGVNANQVLAEESQRSISHPNNFTGDLSLAFRDKKELRTLKLVNTFGIDFKFDDNTFKSGSAATTGISLSVVEIIKSDDDYWSNDATNDDFIGISGAVDRTGQVFSNFGTTLETLTFNTGSYVGGKLKNVLEAGTAANPSAVDIVHQLNLSAFSNMTKCVITGHFVGDLPQLRNMTSCTELIISNNKKDVGIQSMKEGGIYEIKETAYGESPGQDETWLLDIATQVALGVNPRDFVHDENIRRYEWIDMGWVPGQSTATNWGLTGVGSTNAEVVDQFTTGSYNWESTSEHGVTPTPGDLFIFKDLTVNEVVENQIYIIKNLGTTTQSQWNTLAGTSGVTYKVGDRFQASDAGNGVIFENVVSGQSYRILTHYAPVPSIFSDAAWQDLGASSRNPGDTFTATKNGSASSYAFFGTVIGFYARLLTTSSNYTNFGTGTVAKVASRKNVKSMGLIGNIPALTGLNSMKLLDLSNNTLTGQCPSISSNTTGLELYLMNNKLTGSPPDLSTSPNIFTLDMSGNPLTSYQSGNLSGATKIKIINLNGNRFPRSQSYNDSAWQTAMTLFTDLVSAVDQRTSLSASSHIINLSCEENFDGLNYTDFVGASSLDPDQTAIGSAKDLLDQIEAAGFTLIMNGKAN